MPVKKIMFNKVTSPKHTILPKNKFLYLGIINNLQTLNLRLKI